MASNDVKSRKFNLRVLIPVWKSRSGALQPETVSKISRRARLELDLAPDLGLADRDPEGHHLVLDHLGAQELLEAAPSQAARRGAAPTPYRAMPNRAA